MRACRRPVAVDDVDGRAEPRAVVRPAVDLFVPDAATVLGFTPPDVGRPFAPPREEDIRVAIISTLGDRWLKQR